MGKEVPWRVRAGSAIGTKRESTTSSSRSSDGSIVRLQRRSGRSPRHLRRLSGAPRVARLISTWVDVHRSEEKEREESTKHKGRCRKPSGQKREKRHRERDDRGEEENRLNESAGNATPRASCGGSNRCRNPQTAPSHFAARVYRRHALVGIRVLEGRLPVERLSALANTFSDRRDGGRGKRRRNVSSEEVWRESGDTVSRKFDRTSSSSLNESLPVIASRCNSDTRE